MIQEIDRGTPGKAIAFLLMGVAGGLALDLCAKAILASYSLQQFIFLRSAIAVTLFLLLARQFGGVQSLTTQNWRWHLLRAVLAIGSMFGFFYGLSKMPLVNALTLVFTAPLMVTALSVPMLGEHVGWRRWLAVAFGFTGVLIILRPGAEEVSGAALALLFAGFCYACLAITARKLAKSETDYALSLYTILGPLLMSSVLLFQSTWQAPDASGWLLFFLAGACSVIAWIGIFGGYRRGAPAMLAPFEYTALIGGAIAGYLIWNEVPDRWVVLGAIVIIASGLFVVYREVGGTISSRYLRVFTADSAAILKRRRIRQFSSQTKITNDE